VKFHVRVKKISDEMLFLHAAEAGLIMVKLSVPARYFCRRKQCNAAWMAAGWR